MLEDIIILLIPPLGYYEIFKAMYTYYKEVLAVNPYNTPLSIISTLLIAGGLTLYLYTKFWMWIYRLLKKYIWDPIVKNEEAN